MVRSVFVLALLLPSLTSGQVIISEIMYDLAEGSDSGREWIELYNMGATPVTLSELILFESSRKHAIKGESILAPGAYAVIADKPEKFHADYPNYTGLLFDSAFSLNNDGETIELRKGEVIINSVSYTKSLGGNSSGESLQRTTLTSSATFVPGLPTPGTSVPAGGLVRAAVKEKASTKKAAATPVSSPQVLGVQTAHESLEHLELPQETSGTGLWLFGVGSIACMGIAGAVLARRIEADEWTIIEET